MKLYKLFENIILEETASLLTENVSDEAVIDAINGKYFVNITYEDYPDAPPSKRYIQVYNFSDTIADNKAIRAYQVGGGSKTTPGRSAWKIFRLDRIRSWQPTKMKFYRPMDKFNPNGDRTMKTVRDIATFDDKYKTSKYQRKSTDFTSRDVSNISPEEFKKQYQKIQANREKYKVNKPNTSSYIKQNPEETKDNEVSADAIYKLAQATGVSNFDARQALNNSDGDLDAATNWLKKQGFKLNKNSSYIANDEDENDEDEENEEEFNSGEEQEYQDKLDAERKELEDKQAYLAKKEKEQQARQEKLRAKIEKEKELKKRLQQKLKQKNNNNLKTNTNDNTTTSRP